MGANDATGSSVAIDQSSFTNNRSGSQGGAMEIDGPDVRVTTTTFDQNRSGEQGGAVEMDQGSLALDAFTISGNRSTLGGGINLDGGFMDVTRSTFAGNGANGALAFAVAVVAGTVHVTATTITANVAAVPGPDALLGTVGQDGGFISLAGTVIESPAGPACTTTEVFPPQPPTPQVASGGYSIVSDTTCGLSDPTDLSGGAAGLGALGDNGGPTHTALPGAGRPAVDSIPVGVAGLSDATTTPDQRWMLRPQGSACDRGSVER